LLKQQPGSTGRPTFCFFICPPHMQGVTHTTIIMQCCPARGGQTKHPSAAGSAEQASHEQTDRAPDTAHRSMHAPVPGAVGVEVCVVLGLAGQAVWGFWWVRAQGSSDCERMGGWGGEAKADACYKCNPQVMACRDGLSTTWKWRKTMRCTLFQVVERLSVHAFGLGQPSNGANLARVVNWVYEVKSNPARFTAHFTSRTSSHSSLPPPHL